MDGLLGVRWSEEWATVPLSSRELESVRKVAEGTEPGSFLRRLLATIDVLRLSAEEASLVGEAIQSIRCTAADRGWPEEADYRRLGRRWVEVERWSW